MAAIPSRQRNKNGIGGGSTPRRHGAGGGAPFPSRDSPSHNNGTVRPSGAWGTGRLERSSPHFSHQAKAAPLAPQHQSSHGSSSDAYRVACRDRWINITKTMMGERTEITTISGCVYEGVCHVVTPGDPTGSGARGMYQVHFAFNFNRSLFSFPRTRSSQAHIS